jgi:hypothetical protein
MQNGVQYEIYLTKQLDYFNDILPICIEIRKMLKYSEVVINIYESKYKIIVFGHEKFTKRFLKCSPHSLKYQTTLNKLWKTNYPITNEEKLYSNVKIYKNKIKHIPENQIPIDLEKYLQIENMYQDIKKALDPHTRYLHYTLEEIEQLERDSIKLYDILEIQRIVQNPSKLYNHIVSVEKELTNIELSEEENNIIQKVLNHPTLINIIESHGFNLVEEVKN